MYYHGAGILRKAGTRFNGRLLAEIKTAQCNAGHWQRVEEARILFDPYNGDGYSTGEVWTLTPEYWREIAGAERTERRYQFNARTAARYYSRKPPKSEGIPDPLAGYLQEGTGLFPYLLPAIELLYGAQDARTFKRNHEGYRVLVQCPPLEEIRAERWSISAKCARLSVQVNPLQRIPGAMRLRCIVGPDNAPVYQPDFTACTFNLLRSLQELPPVETPWQGIAEELHRKGYTISAAIVKKIANPIMAGAGYRRFLELVEGAGVTNTRELYGELVNLLPENPEPNAIMSIEAEIMSLTLEYMRRDGIPSGLPIYDAILTPYPERVEEAMKRASQAVTGHRQPVRIDSAKANA